MIEMIEEMEVKDVQTATAIIREYVQRAFGNLYWREVRTAWFDEENDQWVVVFEAAPSFTAPYFIYEAHVDAKAGSISKFEKIEPQSE